MPRTKLDESTIPFASIPELNAALQKHQISSSELTKFFSRRLEKLGPQYNALACSLAKYGRNAAKDADSDLKRERFRSPLQGIPYAAKDLLAVAKYPTTWGAKPFADQVFDYDATVIAKLAATQAVLIGKLAMVELAGGGGYSSASASLQGPGQNPWNKSYWSGGSSSGSGIAVAAGLVPYALGSETSGSILTPACYCGVTGLRPTYGLVSRHGAMPLSWTLDKVGVLARSAEDCGLVLHQIAGRDDNDPGSAHKSFYYAPQYYRKLSDLKIGYAEIDFSDWCAEPLRPAFANALSVVKSLGAQMVETKLPDFPYGTIIGAIIDSEAASVFEQFIKNGRVDQLADQSQIDGLKASLTYSALDYLKAMRVRSQIQSAFRQLFTTVDFLIAPTHFDPPDRSDQPFDETPPKRPDQKGIGASLTQASNLCGFPAITIPCGFANGLPVGLQIVGPVFEENRILGLAREFQNRTNFHKQHPPDLIQAAIPINPNAPRNTGATPAFLRSGTTV
ncbi:MAG: amidase [Acidobacteriota bacterium]|nr:amidase [Acidobacteriota bacterium]